MKIAFVYDAIYPFVKGGGEKRIHDIGKRLAKKGHEVHLLGMKCWKGDNLIVKDKLILHGVCPAKPLYNEKGRRSISQALYFSFFLLPELFKHDFDLVDCQSFPFIPSFACKLYCKIKGKPLVMTWLEVWDNYWQEYLGGLKGKTGKAIEKASANLADEIIAISPKTKHDLIKKLKVRKKIHSIPATGLNLEDIKKVKKSKKKFDLLFAGRLIKEKNLELLIKTVYLLKKKFPGIKCGIVGDGPEKNHLKEITKTRGLEKNIQFLNFFPEQKDLFALMKSAKIFAFPSLREGFGITVLEANACGLPAVVVEAEGNAAAKLIRQGFNGFIVKNKAKEFSQKISFLLKNEKQRKKMSAYGLENSKNFDWNEIIKSLEQ